MKNLFANTYEGRTVFITGHTGFKGSWLTAWLQELGAHVIGFSLPEAPTDPSNFTVCQLGQQITDLRGDIRDYDSLQQAMAAHTPSVVFHLAAQPIVLRGVAEPKLTFDTNAGGTVNLLEAVRHTPSVKAVVVVTTDKVYTNQEWLWGYRETDLLGGHAPYGASKAMAELATSAYRNTYFPANRYAEHGVAIATARAGNVIGGGDFGEFRLTPDCMKALMAGEPIGVRNPLSIRPWQHVLEPLSGYLWLAARLLSDGSAYAEAWNFGPQEQQGISAQALVEKLISLWGSGSWIHTDPGYARVETGLLRLSWEKAADRLGWQPVYAWEEALTEIVSWFKAYQERSDMHAVLRQHILAHVQRAQQLGLAWAMTLT